MKDLATLPTPDLESLIAHATDELRKRRAHHFEMQEIDYVYYPDTGRMVYHSTLSDAPFWRTAAELHGLGKTAGWRTVATLARKMAVAHGVEL